MSRSAWWCRTVSLSCGSCRIWRRSAAFSTLLLQGGDVFRIPGSVDGSGSCTVTEGPPLALVGPELLESANRMIPTTTAAPIPTISARRLARFRRAIRRSRSTRSRRACSFRSAFVGRRSGSVCFDTLVLRWSGMVPPAQGNGRRWSFRRFPLRGPCDVPMLGPPSPRPPSAPAAGPRTRGWCMTDTEQSVIVRVPEAPGGGGTLERFFHIAERGSTVRIEILAGVTTWLTMAYILFVNPAILGLGGQGLPFAQVLTVTALAAGVMTILMGVVGKYPFAIAAGLGLNAFVAFTLVLADGLSFPE